MGTRPAILERPAPAEQRISADEAMQKAERFLNRPLGHLLARVRLNGCCFPCVPPGSCRSNSHALPSRGMPPGLHPPSPGLDEKGIVELQGDYSRSAHECQAQDVRPIDTPGKVLVPVLLAWIKQRDGLAGEGICGMSACSFVAVT